MSRRIKAWLLPAMIIQIALLGLAIYTGVEFLFLLTLASCYLGAVPLGLAIGEYVTRERK